jgi:hypothetical protein
MTKSVMQMIYGFSYVERQSRICHVLTRIYREYQVRAPVYQLIYMTLGCDYSRNKHLAAKVSILSQSSVFQKRIVIFSHAFLYLAYVCQY